MQVDAFFCLSPEDGISAYLAVLCPKADCSFVFVVPAASGPTAGGAPPAATLCPSCNTAVCTQCAADWTGSESPSALSPPHAGLSCYAHAMAVAEAQSRKAQADAAAAQEIANPLAALGTLSASVKRCPGCGAGISHYRGHACHHIAPGRGCPECVRSGTVPAAHWCYCCRGPWPCAGGCPTFCDAACDCEDCPTAAPGPPARTAVGQREVAACAAERREAGAAAS